MAEIPLAAARGFLCAWALKLEHRLPEASLCKLGSGHILLHVKHRSEQVAYKTGNPALSAKTFERFSSGLANGESMTLEGTSNKALLLLALTVGGAAVSWGFHLDMGICGTSALVAFVGALVYIFNQRLAFLAPTYAILEGIALGGVSAIFEAKYPGIVLNSVVLTFGTLGTLLLLYRARLIQASENFKLAVTSATGAVALLYLVDLGAALFFHVRIPFIHEAGWTGIGFSLFVVGLAAANLVLDFDFIENGVARKAPKYMEWYSAFGLIVTLVWLYLEILRLLAKLKK
jgi:uncharacterized YccA/Bax inhibitor family protein